MISSICRPPTSRTGLRARRRRAQAGESPTAPGRRSDTRGIYPHPPPQSRLLFIPLSPSHNCRITCLTSPPAIPSGRKIVRILKKNPDRDPGAYDDADVDHMRRVVAYCKRHLAQEAGGAARDPDSRSARSLKNWGHDPAR